MPSSGAIVICGPTASGKSGLALNLSTTLNAEIISADSAQVYRGMDIGTAKPEESTREQVVHHLLDIRDPSEPYSAADFREDVVRLVPDILARGKTPLIVGGTMLYLKALKEGLSNLPEADAELRSEIDAQAADLGWKSLHEELRSVDPVAAERISPTDTQRLQRAIEVYRLTGRALSDFHREGSKPCPFPLTEIAIIPPDRATLHQEIERRFREMLAMGFIDEVEQLFNRADLSPSLPSIRAVGYRQVWSYLQGETSYDEMVEKALAATRQLAKRQFTWLRSWQDLHRLDSPDASQTLKILNAGTILA